MNLANSIKNFKVVIFLCTAALILPIGRVGAQDSLKIVRPEKHSLYKGSKSLQFRISSNFTLNNFDGLSFSGKKHISDKSAVRLGLDVSFSIGHSDSKTEIRNTSNNNSDRQQITLNTLYMKYSNLDGLFKFYWGIGPSIYFYRSYSNGWRTDPGLVYDKRTEYTWSFGGLIALGAEWFPTRNLGLHAEYDISAYYSQRIDKRNYDSSAGSYDYRTRSFYGHLEPTYVIFGLSVYF